MIEPMDCQRRRDRAGGADDVQLAALYRSERPVVLRVLVAAVWNRHDAEELAQEVFARALPHLRRDAALREAPRAYLVTSAKNLDRDRARRRPVLLVPPAGLQGGEGDGAAASPEAMAVAAERRMGLAAALAELSPEHRQVLRMRLLEMRSTEEVAAALGRSRGAVRQLQRRALIEIRRVVGDPDEEDL